MRDFDNISKSVADPVFRKFVYYARSVASRYEKAYHVTMDFEDLYQELQITLLNCCEAVWVRGWTLENNNDEIRNYVCQAVRNRADTMFRQNKTAKRDGIQVELDVVSEYSLFQSKDFDEMHLKIMQEQMRSMLTGTPLNVFNLIMDPTPELVESCEKSSARKTHLKKSNDKIRGANCVRVYKWNVMDTLKITAGDLRQALETIHDAYEVVTTVAC